MEVALVSCRSLPEPDPDAEPLAQALADAGIEAGVLAWDEPGADPSRAKLAVFRSCWNYPWNRDRFLGWVDAAAKVTELWNPATVVRWNMHKSYLLALERQGLAVASTALVSRGSADRLETILTSRGWTDVVVKPAVSAGSYRTLRVRAASLEAGEKHLRALTHDGDALVQPYLRSVEGYGERALVWIDGELTHAVRKRPRFAGEDESVSTDAVPIAPAEARLAYAAVEAVGGELLYARVDVAPGPSGDPVVMELELIEPSLFFAQGPAALARFVRAIRRRLDS